VGRGWMGKLRLVVVVVVVVVMFKWGRGIGRRKR
jgi:hypothetical protein